LIKSIQGLHGLTWAIDRMLETEEAARRLGVKPATLYAYVSRGLLTSHPAPTGRRRSLFDVAEVERVARRSRGARTVETRLATVTTGITQLTDRGPLYRGRPAVDLAGSAAFEEVAAWIWRDQGAAGPGAPWEPFDPGPAPDLGPSDLMRWTVVMAGARDPLRADRRPEEVLRRARRLMATMAGVLPSLDGAHPPAALVLPDGRPRPRSLAAGLAAALTSQSDEALVRWVNAVLVLMADHELATSTVAVRVAASTRADLYDAVLVGLGTIAGPLHGGASLQAHALLLDARRHGVEHALNEALRWQGVVPGFGHQVYRDGDPRYEVLVGLLAELATPEDLGLLSSLVAVAADHDLPRPNVDLALAATALAADLPAESGRILFTVARVAGWVAHYLEELAEPPLRYRARAVYASPVEGGRDGGDGGLPGRVRGTGPT
jgi:citrate synthase